MADDVTTARINAATTRLRQHEREWEYQVTEILQGAKIHLYEGWTQGVDALDKEDIVCSPLSPHAVCWCLGGAIRRASRTLDNTNPVDRVAEGSARERVHAQLKKSYGLTWETMEMWNDNRNRSKEEVLNAVQAAIEAQGVEHEV